jgi:membrane-associated protease RseP (regulator of RpoE activity)
LAAAFKLKDTRGVLVGGVEPGGPAAKAGIQVGDVIRAVDGQAVAEPSALRLAVAAIKPGDRVKLNVLRDGAEKEFTATVGTAPAEPVAANNVTEPEKAKKIGVAVRNLDVATAKSLGVPPSTTDADLQSVRECGQRQWRIRSGRDVDCRPPAGERHHEIGVEVGVGFNALPGERRVVARGDAAQRKAAVFVDDRRAVSIRMPAAGFRHEDKPGTGNRPVIGVVDCDGECSAVNVEENFDRIFPASFYGDSIGKHVPLADACG